MIFNLKKKKYMMMMKIMVLVLMINGLYGAKLVIKSASGQVDLEADAGVASFTTDDFFRSNSFSHSKTLYNFYPNTQTTLTTSGYNCIFRFMNYDFQMQEQIVPISLDSTGSGECGTETNCLNQFIIPVSTTASVAIDFCNTTGTSLCVSDLDKDRSIIKHLIKFDSSKSFIATSNRGSYLKCDKLI